MTRLEQYVLSKRVLMMLDFGPALAEVMDAGLVQAPEPSEIEELLHDEASQEEGWYEIFQELLTHDQIQIELADSAFHTSIVLAQLLQYLLGSHKVDLNVLQELFEIRNAEYGDAFGDRGPVGCLVRLGDKFKRMMTLRKRIEAGAQVRGEAYDDTVQDAVNYCILTNILLMESQDWLYEAARAERLKPLFEAGTLTK